MSLIKETDYGTPAATSDKTVTLTIDGFTVTVPEGTSIMRAAMKMGTEVPRLCATDSDAAFLHHASRGRHGGDDAEHAAEGPPPQRHGTLYLRPSARLPHLLGERQLRAPGHGRRRRPARSALRLRGREPSQGRKGHVQPLFHLRSSEMHRLLALRARLRGSAGHLRADRRRPRLPIDHRSRHGRIVP